MLIYAVCCTSRSGSTYLCDLLRATGRLGMPDEYANAAISEPEAFDRPEYFQSVLDTYATANGVFGVKVTPVVLKMFAKYCSPSKYLFLQRRNTNEQAISFYRAELTNVWARRERDPKAQEEPDYDYAKIAEYRSHIVRINREWEEIFRTLAIDPHRVWYEDACRCPQAIVRGIADYLGVPLKEPIPMTSEFQVMRDDRTREWLARLDMDDREHERSDQPGSQCRLEIPRSGTGVNVGRGVHEGQ